MLSPEELAEREAKYGTEGIWCNFCKGTTEHIKLGPTKDQGYICNSTTCPGKDLDKQGKQEKRIKYPRPQLFRMMQGNLAQKVAEALGINEAVDKPFTPKFAGKKLKSASGAHRFDDGVPYTKLEFDDKFSYKPL